MLQVNNLKSFKCLSMYVLQLPLVLGPFDVKMFASTTIDQWPFYTVNIKISLKPFYVCNWEVLVVWNNFPCEQTLIVMMLVTDIFKALCATRHEEDRWRWTDIFVWSPKSGKRYRDLRRVQILGMFISPTLPFFNFARKVSSSACVMRAPTYVYQIACKSFIF